MWPAAAAVPERRMCTVRGAAAPDEAPAAGAGCGWAEGGERPGWLAVGGRKGPERSGGRRGEGLRHDGRGFSGSEGAGGGLFNGRLHGSATTAEELRSWIGNSGFSRWIGSSGSSATAYGP